MQDSDPVKLAPPKAQTNNSLQSPSPPQTGSEVSSSPATELDPPSTTDESDSESEEFHAPRGANPSAPPLPSARTKTPRPSSIRPLAPPVAPRATASAPIVAPPPPSRPPPIVSPSSLVGESVSTAPPQEDWNEVPVDDQADSTDSLAAASASPHTAEAPARSAPQSIPPLPPSARPPNVRPTQSAPSSASKLPPPLSQRPLPSAPPMMRHPLHNAPALAAGKGGIGEQAEVRRLREEIESLQGRLSAQRQEARVSQRNAEGLRNELAILKANTAPPENPNRALEVERSRHQEAIRNLKDKHDLDLKRLRDEQDKPRSDSPDLKLENVSELELQLSQSQDDNARLVKELAAARESSSSAAAGDDLTLVRGIGPAFAKTLVEHEVTTFAQLASWSPETITEMAPKLKSTVPRVTKWVSSAQELSQTES